MRLWGKLWKDNRMLRDVVITDESDDTRTHKIFRAIEEICGEFDIVVPVWLDSNIRDFKRHKKVRFTRDNFVGEAVDFDYLEILILEE